MGLELLTVAMAIWTATAALLPGPAPGLDTPLMWRTVVGEPAFRPASREVTNWRLEAAVHLDVPGRFVADLVTGRIPGAVSRCVKLNNYWCIKRAGWTGEIASDGEGHVAFASAAEGAQTAALLLRRYYTVYDLRSAQAIVSRWAPAQCGVAVGAPGRRAIASRSLAVRGIGGTLRARWLAAHGRGGRGRAAGIRASVVPDHALRLMPTPTIEAGVTEVPLSTASLDAFLLSRPPRPAGPQLAASGFSCASETGRVASYAARVIAGVADNPNQDLGLFDAQGRSTPNLLRVMANMAATEIGPLKPESALLVAAIAEADARAPVRVAQPAGK